MIDVWVERCHSDKLHPYDPHAMEFYKLSENWIFATFSCWAQERFSFIISKHKLEKCFKPWSTPLLNLCVCLSIVRIPMHMCVCVCVSVCTVCAASQVPHCTCLRLLSPAISWGTDSRRELTLRQDGVSWLTARLCRRNLSTSLSGDTRGTLYCVCVCVCWMERGGIWCCWSCRGESSSLRKHWCFTARQGRDGGYCSSFSTLALTRYTHLSFSLPSLTLFLFIFSAFLSPHPHLPSSRSPSPARLHKLRTAANVFLVLP